ncbi:uncharacterized protein UHOD_11424 [Ustilago sp. UG-2017b]|nr:uncharacterized protein UHOD_11424 [Ustilago sp. UG-2017b]
MACKHKFFLLQLSLLVVRPQKLCFIDMFEQVSERSYVDIKLRLLGMVLADVNNFKCGGTAPENCRVPAAASDNEGLTIGRDAVLSRFYGRRFGMGIAQMPSSPPRDSFHYLNVRWHNININPRDLKVCSVLRPGVPPSHAHIGPSFQPIVPLFNIAVRLPDSSARTLVRAGHFP